MQGSHRAFVQAVAGGEFGKPAPGPPGAVESALDGLRLLMVGGQIEADPTGDVLLGKVAGSSVGEFAVVLPGIAGAAEPCLDGGEFRGQDAFAGNHERLQGAGHSAIAVGPGMNGHQVQVRHRGPHQQMGVVLGVEPVDEFLCECGNIFGVRSGVSGDAGVPCVGDVDRTATPLSGWLAHGVAVTLQHPVQGVQ